MNDDTGERQPKRVCLNQTSWPAHGQETLELGQNTDQNLDNLTTISPTCLSKNDRVTAFYTQDTAHLSQSTVSTINFETVNESYPPTQREQATQALAGDFGEQVCFGMLDNIPIYELRARKQGTAAESDAVSLLHCPQLEYLEPKSAPTAGRLDPHHSKLFKVLNQESGVDLQAMLVYEYPHLSADRSRKAHGTRVAQAKVTLSVNIYGPVQIYDKIGDFLSRCGDFLQPPLRCDRNVYYLNPQSLFGRSGHPPKTLELSRGLMSHIETLSEETDPSSVLETQDNYQETEAPAIIQTSLYSHQKQALTFMLRRETAPSKADDKDPIWQTVLGKSSSARIYSDAEASDWNDHGVGRAKGGLLLDSMGLGKSLSIISLIATDWPRSSSQVSGGKATILVAPSSLVRTWEGELIKHVRPNTLRWKVYHGPNRFKDIQDTLSCDLVITTYNVLSTEWRDLDRTSKPLFSTSWHRIVLDEGHEIRTGTTLRAKSVCALHGDFRWVVTGTPIQNRFEDLASLFKFLNAYPDHDLGSLTTLLRGSKADPDIKRVLLSMCLRRSKAVINLPARIDEIHKVKFDDHEAATYNRTKDGIINYLQTEVLLAENATFSNILVRINTLRQMCNLGTYSPNQAQRFREYTTQQATVQQLFDSMTSAGITTCSKCGDDWSTEGDYRNAGTRYEASAQPHLTLCGVLLCSACSTLATEISDSKRTRCQHEPPCQLWSVQNATDSETPATLSTTGLPVKMRTLKNDILALPITEKSVIFSFWTSTLDLVGRALDEISLTYTRIDGSVPNRQRQKILQSFNDDQQIRALLISLKRGSSGLTLTAANNVFLMEPQWNPMIEDQALDRVYRIGQTKPVTTVRYIVQGTLEESIRHQQSEKRNLAEQAFDLVRKNHDWVDRMKHLVSNRCS